MALIVTALVVGDSISARPDSYVGQMDISAENKSASSQTLFDDIEPAFSAQVAARWSTSTVAMIQGGINDINNLNTLGNMQTAITSMVSTATAASMDIFIVGSIPHGNSAGWTGAKQTQLDDYNTWLAAQASIQGFTYIPVYDAMEDPGTPDQMLAAYDSGDGLHPSYAGGLVMAAEVNAALTAAGIANDRASLLSALWRGAVEPAETGASGNEVKLWRGAVEPSAFAAVPDIVGSTQAAASSALTAAGFVDGTITTAYSATVAVGLVISQNPAAASIETLGTAVDFVVSLGPVPAASSTGGHTSKRTNRKREFVELPNGDFVEVFTKEEADALREQFKPDPEAPQVEQKRILRMTPEVRKMIEKYKKGKGVSSQSLLGKRKGLTD